MLANRMLLGILVAVFSFGAEASEQAVRPESGPSFLTASDLQGGALDLDNEFAVEMMFGDATEMTIALDSSGATYALGQASKAENKMKLVEEYLKTIAVNKLVDPRVGQAGR